MYKVCLPFIHCCQCHSYFLVCYPRKSSGGFSTISMTRNSYVVALSFRFLFVSIRIPKSISFPYHAFIIFRSSMPPSSVYSSFSFGGEFLPSHKKFFFMTFHYVFPIFIIFLLNKQDSHCYPPRIHHFPLVLELLVRSCPSLFEAFCHVHRKKKFVIPLLFSSLLFVSLSITRSLTIT
jgi:hypothetical protein